MFAEMISDIPGDGNRVLAFESTFADVQTRAGRALGDMMSVTQMTPTWEVVARDRYDQVSQVHRRDIMTLNDGVERGRRALMTFGYALVAHQAMSNRFARNFGSLTERWLRHPTMPSTGY